MYLTPVIIILFNRPGCVQSLMSKLREVKPKRIYIIADGPRSGRPDDARLCGEARALAEGADWDCEIRKNYSDANMGCGARVSSGISWVFEQEERAVILEDDCIPDPTFFRFCEELLSVYGSDHRVMCITGQSHQPVRWADEASRPSYFFSRYPLCWGWATWRRAWTLYDHGMRDWPVIKSSGRLDAVLNDRRAVRYWAQKFDHTYTGKVDSWAYRWILSCWLRGGLTASPWTNLVHNIGFDDSAATHTGKAHAHLSPPASPIQFPLRHPAAICRDHQADHRTEMTRFSKSLPNQIRAILRRLLSAVQPQSTGHPVRK
jgi:hypothetical protein